MKKRETNWNLVMILEAVIIAVICLILVSMVTSCKNVDLPFVPDVMTGKIVISVHCFEPHPPEPGDACWLVNFHVKLKESGGVNCRGYVRIQFFWGGFEVKRFNDDVMWFIPKNGFAFKEYRDWDIYVCRDWSKMRIIFYGQDENGNFIEVVTDVPRGFLSPYFGGE